MSSAFTPIDATTLPALNKGVESALERISRANYAALCARALERLGDEKAVAPRLVAAAVRELWEEREGFHSSAEVEGFLNEEFRHRARAVRSRMAAVHRFEKTEGVKHAEHHAPPSVDQLWQEIATALHQPVVDALTTAKPRREHAAHDTAPHIAAASAPRGWKGPAALIVVFLVITHYQRLLDYIKADRISILFEGRVVLTGGPELALELERTGYESIRAQFGDRIMA